MVVLSVLWTLQVLLEPEETSKWKLPLLCVGRSLDFVLRLILQGSVPAPKAHWKFSYGPCPDAPDCP